MDLTKLAAAAGFGANQRNTLRVKLELFAKGVLAAEHANATTVPGVEDLVLRHDHEQVLSLLETAGEYVRAYKCGCNPLWTKDDVSKLLRQIDDALAGREPKKQCDHKWNLWPVADEGWVCEKCGTRDYSDMPPNDQAEPLPPGAGVDDTKNL